MCGLLTFLWHDKSDYDFNNVNSNIIVLEQFTYELVCACHSPC